LARSLLRVYFVRHGETEWTRTGRYTGLTDIALTARGEAEARGVGERLRNTSFDMVLTSPLRRARRRFQLRPLNAI